MSANSLARVLLTTTLVLLGAGSVFPVDAIRDVATGTAPPDAALSVGPAYLLGAPLWRVLDTVALLGLSQHVAVVVTVLVLVVGWLALRRSAFRRSGPGSKGGVGWWEDLRTSAAVLAGLVGVYAAAAFVPHPTTHLTVSDPNLIRVDFHSHTGHSRDAADRYSVEWNRRWHRRAGFDAAFVTDHSSWAAMPEAAASNPDRAGDDVVLLSGAEAWFKGDHAVALGDSTRYIPVFDPVRWRFEPDSLVRQVRAAPATLVILLPLRHLDRVAGWSPDALDGAVAIEVNDGSPKGLEQSRTDRHRVLDIAREHDLALVSGSNTHGTGQVAPAWTLLHLPGWRGLSPEGLERQIQRTLHTDRGDATRVIERTMPAATSIAGLAWTVPAVVWHVLATLDWPERLVWLAYCGLLLGVVVRTGRSRLHPA